jgi:hypothetical protein
MKKLLLIGLLFTACKTPMTTVRNENVAFTFNPKVWKVVEFTKEDSITFDTIINLHKYKTND